jgi:hypothetical protein
MGFVGKPSPYYYKRTTVEPEMFRNLNAVEWPRETARVFRIMSVKLFSELRKTEIVRTFYVTAKFIL